MFGTDWPGVPMKKTIEAFLQLPLSEAAKEAILYRNAARVLKLEG